MVRRSRSIAVVVALLATLILPVTSAGAGTSDSFYSYTGSTPLARLAPGTVLKTRSLSYHLLGVPLPLQAVQILYRSENGQGQPAVNVTSVVKPLFSLGAPKIVAYQSFYDSLNPADEPSRAIAGNVTLGGLIPNVETALLAPLLLSGDTVVIADTEGQSADFAAGREYGINTLNSLRAATSAATTGLSKSDKITMVGYSGGAIATDWAAQLAPTYAPDVNRELIGAAEGGILVDPAHNLTYVGGTPLWAGIAPAALIGMTRAAGIDISSYLSPYGQQLFAKLQNASIINIIGQYPGLKWTDLVKPQYANPDSIPAFVSLANSINMGSAPSPTIPMFLGQGANGTLEGTPNDKPGIGAGDGVMIAGDVRTLARQFCASGTRVQYNQYDATSHVTSAPLWVVQALGWIGDRFAGATAPSNCGQIPAGNPLTPERSA